MPDENIKQFQITGGAAEAYGGGATKKRLSRKKGGGSTSPGTIVQLRADHVPGIATVPVVGVDSALTKAGAPVGGANVNRAPVTAPVTDIHGGAAKEPVHAKPLVKVVLDAPKKRSVVLQPKAVAHPPSKKTRKISRNIKVNVAGLGKRLVRAKTIRKDASGMEISEVKKILHKAGLIKMDSKAPDAILRQMYADYTMLKDRAL